MPPAVYNATPLIYQAKIGKLELLRQLFGEILIPKEVFPEVVERGKAQKQKDAYTVEKAVKEGWIKVAAAGHVEMPFELHEGEAAALSLAKQQNSLVVLVDELSARSAARLLGLTPRGTVFVLLFALEQGHIGFDDFMAALDGLIDAGFRLREEVYIQAVREAKKLAQNQ